ncbi:efflux RND transporter periplasmic adaptor subunit [Rhodanobacter umsongensis]|uniref:Efflux RND transporter periplasmic adaptor subunit n=1 Tax=Rhodanobacter umsongensis TaxID=633153 RepID=A0ABW0JL87_9GAMM
MKNRSFSGVPEAMRRGGLSIAMLMVALAGAGCSASGDHADASAAPVSASNVTMTATQRQHIRLHTVAPSTFSKTVETTGVVDFDNDRATAVLAPFSGPVTRLLVSPGDKVEKGQALAWVDSPDFAQAVSTYRKAFATARNARRLADMDKDLVQHDGVAPREEQQAQTDAANAEADRDAALQALASLGVDRQVVRDVQAGRPVPRIEGSIRAPVSGTVVEKLITPGQLLQAGSTPCFTVADLSRVWVMAQVSGSELASVGIGDPVDVVTGTSSKNLRGTVANVSAQVNPDTRAVAARVVVDNPDDLLKKHMYVSVRIHSRRQSTGLLVPVSAILRDDENLPFVYAAQRDGSFARRHVTLGYRDGDRYEIADGLAAGDQVVVDGGIFVQFMQSQ